MAIAIIIPSSMVAGLISLLWRSATHQTGRLGRPTARPVRPGFCYHPSETAKTNGASLQNGGMAAYKDPGP